MNKLLLGTTILLIANGMAEAQQSGDMGGQSNAGLGTVNQQSLSPDQNQAMTGTRGQTVPSTRMGGVPDNTDRVNGRAYPIAGSQAPAASATAVDQNSNAPVSDKAAMQAAKRPAAPNNSPEANPPKERVKKLTPSPGAEAATRPTLGTKQQQKPK